MFPSFQLCGSTSQAKAHTEPHGLAPWSGWRESRNPSQDRTVRCEDTGEIPIKNEVLHALNGKIIGNHGMVLQKIIHLNGIIMGIFWLWEFENFVGEWGILQQAMFDYRRVTLNLWLHWVLADHISWISKSSATNQWIFAQLLSPYVQEFNFYLDNAKRLRYVAILRSCNAPLWPQEATWPEWYINHQTVFVWHVFLRIFKPSWSNPLSRQMFVSKSTPGTFVTCKLESLAMGRCSWTGSVVFLVRQQELVENGNWPWKAGCWLDIALIVQPMWDDDPNW